MYPSSGIPWALDVISAAIAHQHGSGETFEARLALDILNLLTVRFLAIQIQKFSFVFQGFVIFLVLICKKTVVKKLLNKYSPSHPQSSSSSMKTQESMNLRKFSTVSGISTISTLSADSADL